MLSALLARGRDPRLDIARGICLFLILIDHMPGNAVADWTPGQFGFSDAATVFIFVSGTTAALAFGGVYRRAGWAIGTVRTALRVWQLYIAQIVVVMIVASLPGWAKHVFGVHGYVSALQLRHLFHEPVEAFWGIVTLTYVPPYLDILPVYIAMLAMVPPVMALARLDRRLVFALSFLLWAAVRITHWDLPADPTDGRGWFFDPFSWQLLFFTGFGLGMGWFRVPLRSPWLTAAAVAMLVLGFALRIEPIYGALPELRQVHAWAMAELDKTYLDPLELLHFGALALLATRLVDRHAAWLDGPVARPFVLAGQQSLAVFLATVVLADLGGIAFDLLGGNAPVQVLVNLSGCAALFAVAMLVAWYKSAPWKRAMRAAEEVPTGGSRSPLRA